MPENAELGVPLYAAYARDRDSDKSGIVSYRLTNVAGNSVNQMPNIFAIDSQSGHLTLSRHLDYETAQRHSLIVTATDSGEPKLSANLTILVEVQDVNDNAPVFERNEYSISVIESMPINSQVSFFSYIIHNYSCTDCCFFFLISLTLW